jgi:hypothetical protein
LLGGVGSFVSVKSGGGTGNVAVVEGAPSGPVPLLVSLCSPVLAFAVGSVDRLVLEIGLAALAGAGGFHNDVPVSDTGGVTVLPRTICGVGGFQIGVLASSIEVLTRLGCFQNVVPAPNTAGVNLFSGTFSGVGGLQTDVLVSLVEDVTVVGARVFPCGDGVGGFQPVAC